MLLPLLDAESKLASAAESEKRWQRGEPLGLVDGVRVALKDLILARGWPTLRGSRAVDPNQDWNGGFAGNRATARTWRRSSREDDDIGIRLEGAWRQSSDRDHSQSLECGAHAGRKQRRFGSRRGVRVRSASCCDGWWWLDAASGGAQRCFRVQADIRQGAGLSPSQNGTLFHVTPLTRSVRDPAHAFSKRALQATTIRAIDDARRLDLDLRARGMTDPGSLRAHARRYRELKGRDPAWQTANS